MVCLGGGTFIYLLETLFQFIDSKNGCRLISPAPSEPAPSRLDGFRFNKFTIIFLASGDIETGNFKGPLWILLNSSVLQYSFVKMRVLTLSH